MASNRYHLVTSRDGKQVLVSNSSARLLKELAKAGDSGLTYAQLSRLTRLPHNSLYVFASRLRKAKLVGGVLKNRETILYMRDLAAIPTTIRRVG